MQHNAARTAVLHPTTHCRAQRKFSFTKTELGNSHNFWSLHDVVSGLLWIFPRSRQGQRGTFANKGYQSMKLRTFNIMSDTSFKEAALLYDNPGSNWSSSTTFMQIGLPGEREKWQTYLHFSLQIVCKCLVWATHRHCETQWPVVNVFISMETSLQHLWQKSERG